ncbi:MAG: glycine zipper 2TM domain-containing protein [Hahellaceae bacterium]|nr:glycine zipper 2TM domain-containing protein [Hahellaceae bacterium]
MTMLTPAVFAQNYDQSSNAVWYDSADVTGVEPIYRNVERQIPVENCWTEQVRHESARPSEGGSYLGPVLGAVIGGGLGNAVGHHKRNKQVGTAVGAVLGATVGHEITRQSDSGGGVDVYYTSERRCDTRYETEVDSRTVGYWVSYRYRGQDYRTRMDHAPGDRIRVRVTVEPI